MAAGRMFYKGRQVSGPRYKSKWSKKAYKKSFNKFVTGRPVTLANDHVESVWKAPFPSSKTYNLRYVQTDSLTSVSGAIATKVFRANGIYDPDYSSTGHQPLFRDILASMYNHYNVSKSKIQVFVNSQATSNVADNMVVAVTLEDDSVTATTVYGVLEAPRCKWMLCNQCPMYNDRVHLNKPMTIKFNARKFFGAKRAGGDDTSSLVADNPSEQAFFVINVASLPATANNDTLQVTVVIDYTVTFSEPQTIEAS